MTSYKIIGDRTYAYSITGDQEGEPLVLLHGFTGRKETWQSFIERVGHTYRIVTIDLPGHGQTVVENQVTMDQFIDDLHELIRQLQLDTFHLLGYSLGGRSALSYALRYPETIRSLILESASPGLRTEQERNEQTAFDKQLADKIVHEGVQGFVDYWENIPLFASQKRLNNAMKMAVRNERLSQSSEGLAQSLIGMGTGAQGSRWDDLSSITFPLLLIVGALDEKFVNINEQISHQVDTSTLRIVNEAGHAVHVEKITEFTRIVKGFIDKK